MGPWNRTSVRRSCSCTTANTTPHMSITSMSQRRNTRRH
uniref:Uncharacterized protein n=1 Tax=Anguilla anguilla TaxID=7936 RepID=A0A0E9SC10_ANGAN